MQRKWLSHTSERMAHTASKVLWSKLRQYRFVNVAQCSWRYCRSCQSRNYAIHLCTASIFTYLKWKQCSNFDCLVFEIVSFVKTKHRLGFFRMDSRGSYLVVAWQGVGENCVMRSFMITLTNYVSLILSWSDKRRWEWWVVTHTGCNRRNGPDFGRVFLRSNYTDITQNTYIQSWTFTEILAREKSGLLWCLRTVLVSVTSFSPLLELHSYVRANVAPAT